MTTYTELRSFDGYIRTDMVMRDDGVYVLTGMMQGPDGTLTPIPDFTDPDGLAYQAWLAAGNTPAPPAPPVRTASGYALTSALTDTQATALLGSKTKAPLLLATRTDAWAENDAEIATMATAMSTDPKTWFDAALAG